MMCQMNIGWTEEQVKEMEVADFEDRTCHALKTELRDYVKSIFSNERRWLHSTKQEL